MDVHILIVEDERIVAKDIANRLQGMGYEIAGIESAGENAIASTEALNPDLVLMDIGLRGGMDGIEAAERIRDRFHIPVVYLTAYGSESIIERAKLTEPFGYLMKPFEDKELHTVIEIALFRYKMEKRLKESEQRYRRLFEESRDAIFMIDGMGALTDCNGAFLDLFGYSREEMMGKNLLETCAAITDREKVRGLMEKKGSLLDYEMRFTKREGTEIDALVTITGIRSNDGITEEYQGSIHDITRRKLLELRLSHAQKMEMIGTFASQIAHDFNNIITAMLGYGKLIMMKGPKDAATANYAGKIVALCDRAAGITHDLLAFGRKEATNQKNVGLNQIVYRLKVILEDVMNKNISMNAELCSDDPTIFADQGQIEQVLTNLFQNAQDAMPEGGVIRIRTEVADVDDEFINAHMPDSLVRYACICVEDEGCGIDKNTVATIFEPFFTTKERGKGTGLGLSIVYSIVKQHMGYIKVSSELGTGTAFRIYLPLVERV